MIKFTMNKVNEWTDNHKNQNHKGSYIYVMGYGKPP